MSDNELKIRMYPKPRDMFDRFVNWFTKYRALAWFKPMYYAAKEFWLYALFGLGTIIISILSYRIMTENMGMPILIANAISWVGATIFAFLTNRTWVFTNHVKGVRAFIAQLIGFSGGRFITLIFEEWMLLYFVDVKSFPNMPVKYVAQVLVIIINYLISKLLVFRKKSVKVDHDVLES
ncbi:MAG: GtrA family protein [Lachnospiraceae bacterium]|nr:GtrA family protein [Lachnospiraceae bacterium]